MRAVPHNLGQLVLLVADCLPAPLVRGRAYRAVRCVISRTPARFEVKDAAWPFTRGQWRERGLAGPETDLVVEGFPGSANSFVSNAVRRAVERPARIESHFHYTVQLRRAHAWRVPAVVVVRPPRAACDSLKSKSPATWDWLVALRWLLYHRYVLRHRSDLAIIPFADAVADVDIVRRRVPAVARLVARPLVADPGLRRPTSERISIDSRRRLVGWLIGRAEALHRRLIAATDHDPER